MDRLNRRDMEQVLGIYAPYAIRDISLNADTETLVVQIEQQLSKRGLFGSSVPKTASKMARWQHSKTGRFSTIIQMPVTASTFSKSHTLNPPTFIGPENASYTYQLQQIVLLADSKNISSETIFALTGIDRKLINQIILDSKTEQQESQVNNQLPLETDPVWRAIIKHESSFRSNLPSLKFLIARLELTCANSKDDASVLQDSIATLRQFFIKNRVQLKSEYAQIGVNQVTEKPADTAEKKIGKRKTLTADHPIWNSILSGDVDLLSKNIGLNMFITQLKSLYQKNDVSAEEKLQISRELLSYLKKNMAKLRSELVVISKLVSQLNEKVDTVELPDENDAIWKKVLSGQIHIETSQMALKLLLVKAKSSDDEVESCKSISQYFARNTRALSKEIQQLEQHVAVAS
jgi:hypothetical protein